jgi:hypothetical protein
MVELLHALVLDSLTQTVHGWGPSFNNECDD